MKNLLISTLFLVASMNASADEVGPVNVLNQSCTTYGDTMVCTVVTDQDLGGVSYQLRMEGDAFAMTPVAQILPLVEGAKVSVYLQTAQLKNGGRNIEVGEFKGVVVQPWND